MCSLHRVILALAIFSAKVYRSSAVEGDDDSFFTRMIAELDRDSLEVEHQLRECVNKPRDCKKIDESTVLSHVALILHGKDKCIKDYNSDGTSYEMKHLTNPVTLDSIFRQMCNKVPMLAKCLEEAHGRLQACVCDVEIEVFSIIPSSTIDVLNKECKKNNRKFEEIMNNVSQEFWRQHMDEVGKCLISVFERSSSFWKTVKSYDSNTLAHALVDRYKGGRSLKKCLAEIGKGKDDTFKYFDSLIDLAIQDMRCVKDKSNTLAPCSQVVGGGSQGMLSGLQHSLGPAIFWLVLTCLTRAGALP